MSPANYIHLALPALPRSAVFGGACIILTGVFYLLRWIALPKPIPGIPYNVEASKRILGDIPEFVKVPNRRQWWVKQNLKHQSPMFQMFLRPLGKPWVFLADHHEAVDISTRRLKEFDRSDLMGAQFGGVVPGHHILMRSADPQFKRNKELVRDLMTPSFLHQVSAPQIYDQFVKVIELWDRKTRMCNGRPFEASEDLHHSALDIILNASFGLDEQQTQLFKKLSQLKPKVAASPAANGNLSDQAFEFEPVPLDEELTAFTVLSDSINVAMKSLAPKTHHFLYRNLSPKMRRAAKMRDHLRNREIAKSLERKRTGQVDRCALDQMLVREDAMAAKEGRSPDYHSQMIMTELLGYLIAGHETTSSAIQWGTKYLTDDQRVQTLLREALHAAHPQAVAEHGAPTVNEIIKAHVPYLDATLEEILRHSQPLAITFRQALVDTQILGTHIPKGTNVGLLANGPSILMPSMPIDDAKRTEAGRTIKSRIGAFDESTIRRFVPEQWLKTQRNDDGGEDTVFDPNAGPAQAFGMGPRGCFGKKLAYVELRIYFTLAVWAYKFLPLPEALAGHGEAICLTRVPNHVYLKLEKVDY